ncbi:glycosyltransferase family 39 protein [Pseudonocardia ailaonensis]|uniref:Glycosyltransferase family 39 protein n=1 Tax=Pseudonocardia ailaonensis TaxID=367279 RepID=A0ABN2NPY5_9PSEU
MTRTLDAPTRLARGPVLAISALTALVLGVASHSAGWFFDEQYFLAAGRDHLAWGYMDQPPLVPALAALTNLLAPGSLVVFRLPVTLGAALTVVLAGAIARELGGGRGAQALAAAATACSGIVLLSHWFATYTLDPLFWTAIVWLVARRLRTGDDRLLLLAGVVTGLSLNTKFLVPALWVGLVVALAVCGGAVRSRALAAGGQPGPSGGGSGPVARPRDLLRSPALRAGLGIAAAATVPTLLWQAAHGWPYLGMATVVRRESEGPGTFTVTAFALCGLVGIVLLVAGLVGGIRGRNRWLALTVALVAAMIAVAGGRSYYVLEIVPAALALGAVEITSSARLRRTRGWFAGLGFAVSLVVVAVYLPLLPAGLRPVPALAESGEATMTPAAQLVTRAWGALPDRDRTAVVAQIYPIAAAVEQAGVPAYSGHRGYAYFTPPPSRADRALWIGVDPLPATFRTGFATCTPQPAEGLHLELCQGRTAPWPAVLAPTL